MIDATIPINISIRKAGHKQHRKTNNSGTCVSDSEIRWTRKQNAVAIPRIPNAIPLFFNTDLTFVLIGEPPVFL